MGKIGFKGFTRSADQAGNIYYARRRLNEDFLARFHAHFLKHGDEVIERAAQESPSTYLKCLVQLVPRELQVEHSGSIIGKLSDEQLAAMITELDKQIQDALAAAQAQASAEDAKVINAEPATKEWIAPALAAPYRKTNPKSSPRDLEYARGYASRRRAALKAQKAAALEPPNKTTNESDG